MNATPEPLDDELARQVRALGLSSYSRHIFLCADQSDPKCCAKAEGMASWEYLKKRVGELQLGGATPALLRTKANCLRVCLRGPIVVIYPEGVWYHSCKPEVLERILQEHILNGRVVEEFLLARNQMAVSVSAKCSGAAP